MSAPHSREDDPLGDASVAIADYQSGGRGRGQVREHEESKRLLYGR